MLTIININNDKDYENKSMISTYDVYESDLYNKTILFGKIKKILNTEFPNKYKNITYNAIRYTTYLVINISTY